MATRGRLTHSTVPAVHFNLAFIAVECLGVGWLKVFTLWCLYFDDSTFLGRKPKLFAGALPLSRSPFCEESITDVE
jgi:hypothetical protein